MDIKFYFKNSAEATEYGSSNKGNNEIKHIIEIALRENEKLRDKAWIDKDMILHNDLSNKCINMGCALEAMK